MKLSDGTLFSVLEKGSMKMYLRIILCSVKASDYVKRPGHTLQLDATNLTGASRKATASSVSLHNIKTVPIYLCKDDDRRLNVTWSPVFVC